MYPKLFGGNVGQNNFDGLVTFNQIVDGKIPDTTTAAQFTCLLYMLATEDIPASVGVVQQISQAALDYSIGKLNPVFKNSGCPLALNV